MLHAGLDLSRRKVDVCLVSAAGEVVEEFASPPDADGLVGLARRVGRHELPVRGVIESMTGARFVHDGLEELGWDVLIADAAKVKGLAPLACKTDKIDARVLAVLSHRDLVPEIWLPDPCVRRERELARFRMHLVKHRSMLKHRIHATLISFGHPCPVTDLFGVAGRELLDRLDVPQPWRGTVDASLRLIDDLDRRIDTINRQLRASGADHPYVPLLLTVPGIGWVLGLHHRGRDRRHPPLSLAQEAVRLHRPVPPRLPVRGPRQPRPADQAGPQVPALGDARSHHARAAPPGLPRALPAQQAPPGPPTRGQGRPDRRRQKAHRSDLAHAHQQPALRSRPGRLRFSSGRLTALLDLSPRSRPPMPPCPAAEQAIER
jgi:Transposase